jgi:hypothetical protein
MIVDAYARRAVGKGLVKQSLHLNYVPGAAADAGEKSKRSAYIAKYEGLDFTKLALVAMDTSCRFSRECLNALRWIANAASKANQRIPAWNNSYAGVMAKSKLLLAMHIQTHNAASFSRHSSREAPSPSPVGREPSRSRSTTGGAGSW